MKAMLEPRIAVLPDGERSIGLNPQLLEPGQEAAVLEGVRNVIRDTSTRD